MECNEVKAILKHDSDAEIAANKGLVAHVRSCRACSEKYGFILKLSLATAMKDEVRLPAAFEDGVWKKIGEQNPSFSFLRYVLQPKWALAAAAAIVILVIAAPLMNKSALKDSVKVITAKTVPEITAEKRRNAAPEVLNKSKAPAESVVAGNIVKIPETAGVPALKAKRAAMQKNAAAYHPGITAYNAAPAATHQPAAGSAENGNKISAAGIDQVQKELTASYDKAEDDLKGDVAVSGNVFHPQRGEAVTVKYRIKNAGNVILCVYDRKGKVVRAIYKGGKSPGIYTESWNGTDDNGVTAAGGIYIMYLKTDTSENKIKIGIIK